LDKSEKEKSKESEKVNKWERKALSKKFMEGLDSDEDREKPLIKSENKKKKSKFA
jgi:hypothetical protein